MTNTEIEKLVINWMKVDFSAGAPTNIVKQDGRLKFEHQGEIYSACLEVLAE